MSANFVTGLGHAEFLRRIDYPSPTHVVGWTFTDDLKPFRACNDVKRVLFAPTHPNGDGSMTKHQREPEHRGLRPPARDAVRDHRPPHRHARGQRALEGARRDVRRRSQVPPTAQLPTHRRGRRGRRHVPDDRDRPGRPDGHVQRVRRRARAARPRDHLPEPRSRSTRTTARYPFSCDTGDIEAVIREAALSDEPIAAYKRRFIGEPFHPLKFVELFERVVTESAADPPRPDAHAHHGRVRRRARRAPGPAARLRGRGLARRRRHARAVGARARRRRACWPRPSWRSSAAGIDGDKLPDVLLTPLPGSPQVDALLAERATALLSDWPPIGRLGELPRFPVAALSR